MSATPLLDRIHASADLAALTPEEMKRLAGEIRARLTGVVGRTGGHLASNLGVVEITLALHRCFDFNHDRLVFDVGHQCYTHKLLTGRQAGFERLRRRGGVTGFPNPAESVQDPFIVGHASTSLSSAAGLAAGYRMAGESRHVVALVGDGAIGGGLCFEAMNHIGAAGENVLVVLNDNDMAIAETVGAFSTYLTEIRSRPETHRIHEDLHQLLRRIPLIGEPMDWLQEHAIEALKDTVEAGHIFRALGFRYFGPLDGHDMPLLESEFRKLKQSPGPRILHVVTRKGFGFDAASSDPETYHSAVPFEVRGSGQVVPRGEEGASYTSLFVERLGERAAEDGRIVAITAAMPAGTGIREFAKRFPDRFVDVGICEAHSVTFAAALARTGRKPVVAIYSTFLQRAYDQIVHDLAVQPDLAVVLALDRAGLVGADGPTHHGVFDIAFLRHIPRMVLMAPRDGPELQRMLDLALACDRPVAIRYPRGCPPSLGEERTPLEAGKSEPLREGNDGTVFAYGRMVAPALAAAEALAEEGIDLAVVNARFAKPLDTEAILAAARGGKPLFTVEDHVLAGGFGSAVAEVLADAGIAARLVRIGIPDRFVEHGTIPELDAELGLDVEGLRKRFREVARKKAEGIE